MSKHGGVWVSGAMMDSSLIKSAKMDVDAGRQRADEWRLQPACAARRDLAQRAEVPSLGGP